MEFPSKYSVVVQLFDDRGHGVLDGVALKEMQVQLRAQHPLSDSLPRLFQGMHRGEVPLHDEIGFHKIIPDRCLLC
jgi:hypothetical protein